MKTVVLATILTASVAVAYGFGVYLFPALMIEMKRDLSFGYSTVGMIAGTAQIGFLVCALVGSVVSTIVGGPRFVLLSLIVCSACLLGLGFSTNSFQAGALLLILGGCAACIFVPLAEIITRNLPPGHRSTVFTLTASGASFGVFANGITVPIVVAGSGWRHVWLLAGGAGLVLASCAYCAFRYYHLLSAEPSPRSPTTDSRAGSGWLVTPAILKIWAISFLAGLALLPFLTYLVPIVREEFDYPISAAGQIWSSIGFVGMGAGFIVGALSQWIGIRQTLLLTLLCGALSAGLVWGHAALWQLHLAATLFGISFYPLFGLIAAYLTTAIPTEHLTKTFGCANVMFGLGATSGNFLGGLFHSTFGNFVSAYAAISGVLFIALILAFTLRERENSRELGTDCAML